MMTTKTAEDYNNLLSTLAGFVVVNQDRQLNAFMTGYVDDEWDTAVRRARARQDLAERRQNEPMLWD